MNVEKIKEKRMSRNNDISILIIIIKGACLQSHEVVILLVSEKL